VDADPLYTGEGEHCGRRKATNAFRRSTGIKTTACLEGTHRKHGKPMATAAVTATGNPRGLGPVASVTERLVVAWKPGNSGGAKGPQFKDQRTQEEGKG
jgi:hypothetical protein